MAETFDEVLIGQHHELSDLPDRPLLSLNTTVLNNAQVGRFSRGGFSCEDLAPLEPSGSYPELKVDHVTTGFAAAASAAFPFGLAPLPLPASGTSEKRRLLACCQVSQSCPDGRRGPGEPGGSDAPQEQAVWRIGLDRERRRHGGDELAPRRLGEPQESRRLSPLS